MSPSVPSPVPAGGVPQRVRFAWWHRFLEGGPLHGEDGHRHDWLDVSPSYLGAVLAPPVFLECRICGEERQA